MEITITDRILKELQIIDRIFKSQLFRYDGENSYPFVNRNDENKSIDTLYLNYYNFLSDNELFELQSFKKEFTERFENTKNPELVLNQLVEINTKAIEVLEYFEKNLTQTSEIALDFLERNNKLGIEEGTKFNNKHLAVIIVQNYQISEIVSGTNRLDSSHSEIRNHYAILKKYGTFNELLSGYCKDIISFINKIPLEGKKQIQLSTKNTRTFIDKIRTFYFGYICYASDFDVEGKLQQYTFNDVIVGNVNYYENVKMLYDNFISEVQDNLILMTPEKEITQLVDLSKELHECSVVINKNITLFDIKFNDLICQEGILQCDDSISDKQRESLIKEEEGGGYTKTTWNDYFKIKQPGTCYWTTPQKDEYEGMIKPHTLFIGKAIDKINEFISNRSEPQIKIKEENNNFETTEETVRRILNPLTESGSHGMVILEKSDYENLVSAYVNWIDYQTLPKIDRFNFHGLNKDFFIPLRKLHDEIGLKIKGTGEMLTRLLLLNNKKGVQGESMSPKNIDKNIIKSGKYD